VPRGRCAYERLRSFHLAAPNGRTWSAGDAVAPTLRLVPGLRPVAGAEAQNGERAGSRCV
jgi:hypothetical protein